MTFVQGKNGMSIAVLPNDNTIGKWIEENRELCDVSGSVQRCPRARVPDPVAIDVGAYIGDTAASLVELGYNTVFAFEPMPDAVKALRWNAEELGKLNHACHVIPMSYAVGAGESVSLCWNLGGNLGSRWVTEAGKEEQQAQRAIALDEIGFGRVDLLKIDVEGRERAVLLGARALVEASRPHLHIELNREALERQGDSPEALLELLAELGYRNGTETYRFGANQWDLMFVGGEI